MKTVISVASVVACAFLLDAQIATTMNQSGDEAAAAEPGTRTSTHQNNVCRAFAIY